MSLSYARTTRPSSGRPDSSSTTVPITRMAAPGNGAPIVWAPSRACKAKDPRPIRVACGHDRPTRADRTRARAAARLDRAESPGEAERLELGVRAPDHRTRRDAALRRRDPRGDRARRGPRVLRRRGSRHAGGSDHRALARREDAQLLRALSLGARALPPS